MSNIIYKYLEEYKFNKKIELESDCAICLEPIFNIQKIISPFLLTYIENNKLIDEITDENYKFYIKQLKRTIKNITKKKYSNINHYITINCGDKFHDLCFLELVKQNDIIKCPIVEEHMIYIDMPL